MKTDNLVSVSAACMMLGIRRSTFYRLVREGQLEVIKIGRRTLIAIGSIEAFVRKASAK